MTVTIQDAATLFQSVLAVLWGGIAVTAMVLMISEYFRAFSYHLDNVIAMPSEFELRANPLAVADFGFDPSFETPEGLGIPIIACFSSILVGLAVYLVAIPTATAGSLATAYIFGVTFDLIATLYIAGAFAVVVSLSAYFSLLASLHGVKQGWYTI